MFLFSYLPRSFISLLGIHDIDYCKDPHKREFFLIYFKKVAYSRTENMTNKDEENVEGMRDMV